MNLSDDIKLDGDELERYKRQLRLNGFTPLHQKRLKKSTVFIAGIGGVGGTAALYLACAGIGRLVLAHYGDLTLSNLNRQILMSSDRIGEPRIISAKEKLTALNPLVTIETHNERLSEENISALLHDADAAISARPNFTERRILNTACVNRGIPMVEGAMNDMEGYLLNIIPGKTPCLNCIYPEDDPDWKELGFPVLGALSGMLGCLMSIEAIKMLTGFTPPLDSEMLWFDLKRLEFKKLKLHIDRNCNVCQLH